MKKLLVLALLIASVTFIFAVESDFSDVVGYVKYELYANDFNMIALPMGDTGITTTAELAAAISPDVTSISVWDNETHGWKQYLVSTPGSSFAIEAGDAFLVYMAGASNVDFYCAGTLPTQANYDFIANDYHTVMLPLNRSDLTSTAQLASSIGSGVTSISTWDNATHGWKQYLVSTPGSSFDINIGDGFLIYSTEAYTGWNAPAGRNITTKRATARK
ncbi:hypothetical protein JEZ13_09975 [bacterium]|nr:hypothetical protein [bacterium]